MRESSDGADCCAEQTSAMDRTHPANAPSRRMRMRDAGLSMGCSGLSLHRLSGGLHKTPGGVGPDPATGRLLVARAGAGQTPALARKNHHCNLNVAWPWRGLLP